VTNTLQLKGTSILVADASKHIQNVVKGILRQFGCADPVAVSDGSAALSAYRERLFDAVICESLLPELSGFDFVRAVRRLDDPVTAFNPIILLTSHTQKENIFTARDAGTTAVLAKPISPKLLFERLMWVSNDGRSFVRTPNYIGPDRRFHDVPVPAEQERRSDWLRAVEDKERTTAANHGD